MEIVRVDEKGRVTLPKDVRENAGIRKGSYIKVRLKDEKTVVIEPLGSIAERFYGALKIEKWPEDLDEFAAEAIKRWWLSKDM